MTETYMLQALTNGLQKVCQNTNLLDEILDALNPGELSAAKKWFGDPRTQITIAPGFPVEQTKMPFIGVAVAQEDQDTSQTPVGFALDRTPNGDGTWTDVKGAVFDGTIKATIYTPNADLVIWLSAFCLWALMDNYDLFFDGAGIWDVQIGLGDYEPSPQWLPVFVFARGVYIRGNWLKTFTGTPNLVTSHTESATFTDMTTLKEG